MYKHAELINGYEWGSCWFRNVETIFVLNTVVTNAFTWIQIISNKNLTSCSRKQMCSELPRYTNAIQIWSKIIIVAINSTLSQIII